MNVVDEFFLSAGRGSMCAAVRRLKINTQYKNVSSPSRDPVEPQYSGLVRA